MIYYFVATVCGTSRNLIISDKYAAESYTCFTYNEGINRILLPLFHLTIILVSLNEIITIRLTVIMTCKNVFANVCGI